METLKRDRIGEALKKHKAFWAFSTEQFESGRVKCFAKFVNLGAGLICPKGNHEQLIEDIKQATKDNIKDDLEANTKAEIIRRELANYEAGYTGDIDDTVRALDGYGITQEEVQTEFKVYIKLCE